MFKKAHLLAGLGAAAVVLSALASPARAEAPDRVPRVMMTNFGYSTLPVDWDAEGALAMIVMPQGIDVPMKTFNPACDCDWLPLLHHYCSRGYMYDAIMNTLQRNLAERIDAGEITEEELAEIADLLFGVFDGNNFYLSREVNLVARGGAQRLTNVYFGGDEPPKAAMVHAGPDGDVLVLGEFCFHEVNGLEAWSSFGCMVYRSLVVVDPAFWGPDVVSHRAQIAIGWFTK